MSCYDHKAPEQMCSYCGMHYCDAANHGHTIGVCLQLLEYRKRTAKAAFLDAADKLRRRMGGTMKLSPAQQRVVDQMRKGWQLRGHWGLSGSAWLYKDYQTEDVKNQTFFALRDRGLLTESRVGDKALYLLNEETQDSN